MDDLPGGGAGGTAAVISPDADFRDSLRSILSEERNLHVAVEISVPFPEIADPELEKLRNAGPELVFLDLDSDPHVGLKFAQFLIDEGLALGLIGAGSDITPDLLLEAMRSGMVEFLPKPVTPESVVEAVDRVGRKQGKKKKSDEGEPGELITVFSAKGGAGSTTLATNLAVEIHRLTRKKTLLVDLDLELGETALLLGMDPRFSIVDLVRNFHRVDAGLLASYIERDASGVELLSAPYEPADFEAVSGDRVGKILGFLKQRYDYIVADTPKTFNPVTLTAFQLADRLVLVSVADLQSLRNLARSLPLLKRVGSDKGDDFMRLVVNRYESGSVISLSEVRKTLELDVFATVRNDYRTVMESINEGRPAVIEGQSEYAQDVRSLAGRLTGVEVTEDRGAGLIGKFTNLFRGEGSESSSAPSASR